ncbi:MAG: lysophospholipid acyltransferase family protein [Bacteroidaceae bacterium]|nr:lysophospholipid acyltransferase family protein [Bacteroidaceae bacterium]
MKQLTYYILYGTVYLLSLLPMWLHYRLSDLLYVIIYHVARYRRKVVRKNMSLSFPDKTKAELRRLEHQFYVFFCDYIVENIKLLTMRKKNLMKRMVFEGMDEINKSFEDHDFVFIYLGHYGNWEYIASLQWWVTDGIRCAQLYSVLHNPAFDRLFLKIRSRYGGESIKKNESLRHIINYRRNGEKAIIGFISDQTPRWGNIHMWLDFLHQDTPVFNGTERIAKKVNAAVYYGEMTQPRRGYYRCRFRLMSNDVNALPDGQLTVDYMGMLEQNINKDPRLWLWTHNRWKRQREQN